MIISCCLGCLPHRFSGSKPIDTCRMSHIDVGRSLLHSAKNDSFTEVNIVLSLSFRVNCKILRRLAYSESSNSIEKKSYHVKAAKVQH